MLDKGFAKKTFMRTFVAFGLLLVLPVVARSGGGRDSAPRPAPTPVAVAAPPTPPADPPTPPAPPARPGNRAWLGIYLSDDEGVRVERVEERSPAEAAGLQEGDRIVTVDDRKVEVSRDVRRVVRDLEPGDAVRIVIERKGKEKTLTATLGEQPERIIEREFRSWGPDEGFHPGPFWKTPPRTYIGVQVQPMTEDLRTYFKAPKGLGLLVSKAEHDSPGARAGLRAGDVIIGIDGKEVSDRRDLREALVDHEPGDKLPIRIIRDGAERTLQVEVAERPAPDGRHGAILIPEDGDFEMEVLPEESREEVLKVLHDAREMVERSRGQREEMRLKMQEALEQLKINEEQREEVQQQAREAMEQAQETVRRVQESIKNHSPGVSI